MNLPIHSLIPGYQITELLYSGNRTLVYRAIRECDQQKVVIKRLRQENPSFAELMQFQNQYRIAKNLEIPTVIQTYALESLDYGYALVMEDCGGISLSQYAAGNPLSVEDVFAIALQLTEALHYLFLNSVIHKDIKPANILIHPHTKQIKLIDFSISTLLPKETQAIQNPNVLEGTLAYLSPEQTGRMNRGVDYRSDFYSLGITLYELLTGQLPFQSNDSIEWVHFHLAKVAAPVHHVNPEVPEVLSQIVAKLMAKNAEDRYQSAVGLKYDLEHGLAHWQETGSIPAFTLGRRDISDRFTIPEKLYGREVEIETLLAAFERVAQGKPELMLVSGQSGIGKTAIVNEVHKPIVRQRGYFIQGKFDQFQRNIPFSAFVQALRDLMRQLLCESDRQLAEWKAKICAALAGNGQVLIEVIPELKQIIGRQPAVPVLTGTAAQNRFNLLFQKFIQVFSALEHPLVMFIDDLQWADAASLNLLKLLMQDAELRCLLIIGAYRENEVSPAHPLSLTLNEIRQAQATVNRIQLSALNMVALNQLIADTLSCSITAAMPLMKLLLNKTQGNPFFTTQFLKALHREGLITFDWQEQLWQCDMSQLKVKTITENVVEFMAERLQRLPKETQEFLQLAACIGNQFDLATLAIVSEKSETEVATHLWKALQEELVLPVNDTYKFFQRWDEIAKQTACGTALNALSALEVPYKFLHDRVQQAAYLLIPEATKPSVHVCIGELLLAQTPLEHLDERIFEIVNQFNLGVAQLSTAEKRAEVAELNLRAGRKARLSSAYVAAAQYCEIGLQVLAENAWECQPALAMELHLEAANAAYLIGEFEKVDTRIAAILQHTSTASDSAKAIEIQIQSLIARNQLSEAIQVARGALQKLGVELPDSPTQEMTQLALSAIDQQIAATQDVFALPSMSAPEKLAALRLLSSMASAAYIGSPTLYPLVVLKQIELSLQGGNTLETAYAYSTYGLILCAFAGEIAQGNQAADIALELMEQYQAFSFKAKILNLVYPFVRIWQEPLHQGLTPLLSGYQAGIESGDLEFAAYCAFNHCQLAYFAGVNLLDVKQSMQTYGAAIAHFKQTTALNFHQIGHQAVLNWLGEAQPPHLLIGEVYNETERLPQHQAAGDAYAVGTVYLHKLMLAYHFAPAETALATAALAEGAITAVAGTVKFAAFHFYRALTRLANADPNIDADLDQLSHWAIHAPMNFTHKCDLIQAERCRVLGQKADAIEYYDRAISGAKASNYLQEQALANELAAKFYLNWGKMQVAAGYLQEAYYCYARWGAKAKIEALERHYPNLLAPLLQRNPAPEAMPVRASVPAIPKAPTTSLSHLVDLGNVLKAAEALNSEINLNKLLAVLIQVIIENTGADKAALFLHQEDELNVAVQYFDQAIQSLRPQPIEACHHFPTKVIYYVKHTLAPVITGAQTHPSIIADPYFVQHQPKSFFCAPILGQGKLVGVLYLENSLTSAAFTNDRVELLKLLCAQAAISLENAKLYQDLQRQVRRAEFRAEVDAVIARSGSMQEILTHCTNAIVKYLDAAFARIWTFNAAENVLELQASSGLYTHVDGDHSRVPVGQFKIGLIAEERQPHLTNSVLSDPRVSDKAWAKREGMVAFAGYPLIVGEQLIGVLALFARHTLPDSTLQVLETVAQEIALGIKRKQAEEALYQKEAQYRGIFESVDDGLNICDLETGMTMAANPVYCQMFGLSHAEALEIPPITLVHPDNQAKFAEFVTATTAGKQFTGEVICLRRDGTAFPVDIKSVPFLYDGKSSALSLLRDISDRKQAEAELKQVQLQMIQSEKMSALGNLMAGVAHEINNPVAFLKGNIQPALDYITDLFGLIDLYEQKYPMPDPTIQAEIEAIDLAFIREDLPKLISSMREGVDRIRAISTSLRTFTRADSEKPVLFNLHEGLDSTLLILKHRLKAYDTRPAIEIVRRYGNIPLVECFAGQLSQVFMNIIANAIDALEEFNQTRNFEDIQANPNCITITTRLIDAQDSVCISIKDNGMGMSEEIRQKIFDHLFTTKAVGQGTGLGLAIAQQIVVEKHRGTLDVISAPGEGAEFIITLPIQAKQ